MKRKFLILFLVIIIQVFSIVLVGNVQSSQITNGLSYLTSTQNPDGSWEDDPYSTALALRALANVKPNLSISSGNITFSNPTPTVGETITITANIKNTGSGQADNVLVQFFDGDPSSGGTLIEETTITSIAAYGTEQTSITYTIPTASSKTIFIKIDPLNSVFAGFVIENMTRNVVKILQENNVFYDSI